MSVRTIAAATINILNRNSQYPKLLNRTMGKGSLGKGQHKIGNIHVSINFKDNNNNNKETY